VTLKIHSYTTFEAGKYISSLHMKPEN